MMQLGDRNFQHNNRRKIYLRKADLRKIGVGLFLIFSAREAVSLGVPITPLASTQIIETLPRASVDKDLRGWQSQLKANPADWETLLALGNRYLQLAARSGDERYLGYAEQLLQHHAAPHPAQIDLLQARLL